MDFFMYVPVTKYWYFILKYRHGCDCTFLSFHLKRFNYDAKKLAFKTPKIKTA